MIENEEDLFDLFWVNNRAEAARSFYKETACGAWIQFSDEGIRIGSIVEGCDFGTMIYPLTYPFSETDLDIRIDAVEAEAGALWKWANEVDEATGMTPAEAGADAPDVDVEYRHLGQEGRST